MVYSLGREQGDMLEANHWFLNLMQFLPFLVFVGLAVYLIFWLNRNSF